MASGPHLSIDPLPILRWIMAPERRSNAAGPDTETSVQKGQSRQTNDADIGKWRAMLERNRDRQGEREERERERERLLGLIASSLCREDKQKDYGVHFSRVTLCFCPTSSQALINELIMDLIWELIANLPDTEYCCWLADVTVFWSNVSPCPLFTFCLHCTNKMSPEKDLWRSVSNTSAHVFNLKEIRFCIMLSEGK